VLEPSAGTLAAFLNATAELDDFGFGDLGFTLTSSTFGGFQKEKIMNDNIKAGKSSPTGTLPRHFYSLDALRGLAAFAVVFWHWHHFFYRGTALQPNFDVSRQPLFALFQPFYMDGWRAVDLFFCLSGFIFFWLYSDKISRRQMPGSNFFILRFSRLYPLHLLTLIIVMAGQKWMMALQGSYFVVPNNDLYHFLLQTAFASSWGFEKGYSFNAPIWSVSVEILCYAAFFITCLFRFNRWWCLVPAACAGCLLRHIGQDLHDNSMEHLGGGIFGFFVGALAFQVFEWLNVNVRKLVLPALSCLAVLLWIFIPLDAHYDLTMRAYKAICGSGFYFHGKDIGKCIVDNLSSVSFELFLFPVTIVTLALWETRRGTLGRRLAWLGNISYSSYLLHFPLQIVFAGMAMWLGIQSSFFYSPVALLMFFGALIPLSLLSYKYFERPCQSFLRDYMIKRPATIHIPIAVARVKAASPIDADP